jgi:glucose/arabinose dehydrogenase
VPSQIRMRRIAVIAAVAVGALSLAGSASALRLVPVAGGFTSPIYATSAPGTGDLFVVRQNGYVTRIHGGQRNQFLDIDTRVQSGGEEGLLSIAFHPRYQQNRRFFVYYTNNDGNLRIVGFRANAAGTRGIVSSAKVWIRIHHPDHSNHNGGQLQFGHNGWLYAATGDGGSGGDNARDRDSRLGKLLRLNVDNPDARARIAAVGFRNPWRFSVDAATGKFFIADVGESTWEEIDVFTPSADGLENYGWNRFEGDHQASSNPLGPGRYVRPIHEYAHGSGRCSVTGGFMVRGGAPGAGRYFYGDYCTGEVWSFRYAGGQKSGFRREDFTVPGNLSAFGIGPGGSLLAVSHGGTVYRVARDPS